MQYSLAIGLEIHASSYRRRTITRFAAESHVVCSIHGPAIGTQWSTEDEHVWFAINQQTKPLAEVEHFA